MCIIFKGKLYKNKPLNNKFGTINCLLTSIMILFVISAVFILYLNFSDDVDFIHEINNINEFITFLIGLIYLPIISMLYIIINPVYGILFFPILLSISIVITLDIKDLFKEKRFFIIFFLYFYLSFHYYYLKIV
jgi:hypothetical protein